MNDGTLKKSYTGTTTHEKTLTKPTSKVIAEVFPAEISAKSLPPRSVEIVAEVFPQVAPPITSAMTKGDILGYSDETHEDNDSSDDGADVGDIMGYTHDKSSEDDSSDSEKSITSKRNDDNENVDLEVEEFILPDTVERIRGRFNELYVGFVRMGKHENRNEFEFLLDELLRQGALDPTEYTQLNTRLTEEEDLTTDKEEKEEEDEKEDNMTNAAIQYMILNDKEELQDLMEDIKEETEFMDIVLGIEKLLEEFFVEEFFVDGETIRPQINALINQLENAKIPKSKQHSIKMLLDDIEKNRYRVEQIFQRLMDAEEEEKLTVLQM